MDIRFMLLFHFSMVVSAQFVVPASMKIARFVDKIARPDNPEDELFLMLAEKPAFQSGEIEELRRLDRCSLGRLLLYSAALDDHRLQYILSKCTDSLYELSQLFHVAATHKCWKTLDYITAKSSYASKIINLEWGRKTPLTLAIMNQAPASFISTLIKNGADVNAITKSGLYPLSCALIAHRLDVVDVLVNHQADVNIVEPMSGSTPLHCAATHRFAEGVLFLLKHGANKTVRNKKGLLPLDIVLEKKMYAVTPMFI